MKASSRISLNVARCRAIFKITLEDHRWWESVYRIPTAAQVIEIIRAAGFDRFEHQPGDDSTHDIHCFAARVTAGTA